MASAQNERELSFTPYQPAAEEEYMNDAQLAHFRKILLANCLSTNTLRSLSSAIVISSLS